MRDGYQKDVGELNLTACGFGNCNSIFLSEVQCRLPIHDFLSWRVRPAVVLLRMPSLSNNHWRFASTTRCTFSSEIPSGAWTMIARSRSTVMVSFFRFAERTIL